MANRAMLVVAPLAFLACTGTHSEKATPIDAGPVQAAAAPKTEVSEVELSTAPLPEAQARAAPADAVRQPDGVACKVLRAGTGTEHAGDDDNVLVHYTLRDAQGKVLDSTLLKQRPMMLLPAKTPPGWHAAFTQLVQGERARFWIPAAQSFKEGTGPQGDTVLDVELLRILKGAPPPPAPADVAAPPRDARSFPSGLAMKVLAPGKGKKHPTSADKVVVIYTGWRTDGETIDSSHGRAILLPLADRMRGWQDALPRMVEGERARIWVPSALAYGQGMLVFDVELVKIGG